MFGSNPSQGVVKDLRFRIIADTDTGLMTTHPWTVINGLGDTPSDTTMVSYEKDLGDDVNY